MIETIKTSPKLWASALGLGLVPWTVGEVVLDPGPSLSAVRGATLVGLVSFPLLIAVYRRGFRGRVVDSIRSIAYSFAVKFAILAGSSLMVYVFFTADVVIFTTLLFFLQFSLTFFAIYLARRASRSGGL